MGDAEGTAQESGIKEQLRERQSEATSPETLSDLEAEEKVEDSSKTSVSDVPAPDAQPEEPRKEHDEAGPM